MCFMETFIIIQKQYHAKPLQKGKGEQNILQYSIFDDFPIHFTMYSTSTCTSSTSYSTSTRRARSTIKETLRACVRKVGAFRNLLVEVTTGTEERTGRYEYHTRRVLPLTLVAMMDWILPHDALYCTLY